MNDWKEIRSSLILSLLILFLNSQVSAQTAAEQVFCVMFYNVENLFDTSDDPLTQDDEFASGGMRNWNAFRLNDKLNKISKVIMTAGGYKLPAIVGLCEVENRSVLEQLVTKTPLDRFNYRIIHKDSPDGRGIDVALLYRPDVARPLHYTYHPLISNTGDTLKSREILEASFVAGVDTIHLFFNHWPSRYSGQAETESERLIAALTLRKAVDKLQEKAPTARIIIMGDFNDEPEDSSLKQGLRISRKDHPEVEGELVDLSIAWKPRGTLKHQYNWQIFDQVIVSDELLHLSGVCCSTDDAEIVAPDFLFENDDRWGGKRLHRTYSGYQYVGGFSDHLPVVLKLRVAD